MTLTRPRTVVAVLLLLALASAGLTAAGPAARAIPVATDAATYAAYGRVFPDPQGCLSEAATGQPDSGVSPYAQGNVCSADFIQYQEMIDGFSFLETVEPAEGRPFADFMEFTTLEEGYADALDLEAGEGFSEGLPQADGSRLKSPLYLLKITDEDSDVPEAERAHFAFSLSIHGIERAGAEGGIRAAEDFVTNAATAPDTPLVATDPTRSTTFGETLEDSVIYFAFPNPDGWIRGDTTRQNFFYQRYNGNGVDLNRDWPAQGYTFRPYTPLSESETRSYAKVLQSIKDATARGRFDGGNDLHGQLIDRAFSFTLIGSVFRPFDKNDQATKTMRRIWADQERRLSWSALIKPNDAPPNCVEPGLGGATNPEPGCDPTARIYADQWGTVWDTIDYTVTGAFGDWMDSPIGLDALGLDNEMSLSHLSNCGVGKCYVPEVEQLHVDGNKGLIYAQINFALNGLEAPPFRQPGHTAYVVNPDRAVHEGSPSPQDSPFTDLPPQEPVSGQATGGEAGAFVFEVEGPDDGVYNGGLTVKVTYPNAQGVSPGATTSVVVERRRPQEQPAGEDEYEEVNADFNQSPIYLQGGMTVNVNAPLPGTYRVRLEGPAADTGANVDVTFTTELSWPDPGQLPYDIANTDFFSQMEEFALERHGFTPLTVDEVLDGADLSVYDAVVLADEAMPGYVAPEVTTTGPAAETVTATVPLGAPGAGARTDATSVFVEFEVPEESNTGGLAAEAVLSTAGDIDLYLQEQDAEGSYGGDLASAETGDLDGERLTYAAVEPGTTYRLEVHNWAAPAGDPVSVTIRFTRPDEDPAAPAGQDDAEETEPEPEPSRYTDAQLADYLNRLASFASDGGNLVLTDRAVGAVASLPSAGGEGTIVGEDAVSEELVYAGNAEFNDGEAPTYAEQDLAKEINQPGAAEGDDNRHQLTDPIPTGHRILDPSGGDLNSMRQYTVAQEAWEEAGGLTVGQVNGLSGVTLGELRYGAGSVRIVGSLLPEPTEEFDHPFGLAPYALTYSGFQVFDNLLQFVRPGGAWRLAGENRFETAAEVAYRHWNTVESVVIANGSSFADALTAAPLATALDAPLLLSPADGLDPHAFEYLLTRNPSPVNVYLIGGEEALSEQVADDVLRTYAENVVRLGGGDRYETAVRTSEALVEITGVTPDRAVIATGTRFPDALTAGPIAGNYGADGGPVPLLLVNDQIPEVVQAFLDEQGITETLVAGGSEAVPTSVVEALPDATVYGGADRFETAVLLADLMIELRGESVTAATVATGGDFPDALVVSGPGGRDAIPTLLTGSDALGPRSSTVQWFADQADRLRTVYVAGGEAVLDFQVDRDIQALSGRTPLPAEAR